MNSIRPTTCVVPAIVAGLLAVAPGPSGAVIPKGQIIELQTIASGMRAPIGATHAGDGSGRLFIWDQSGTIWIHDGTSLLATPFLNISSKLPALNPGFDERGLLGVAFHPNYETNGRFFVRYSAPRPGAAGEPCFGTSRGCHDEVLAEYHVSAGDPNLANPASEIILFRVAEPQFNHNGGMVAFGPDGYLYFSLGDGGGAHDGLADTPPSHGPIGNGQNIETALGAILRIDVDAGPPYGIPADNPFVGGPGLDEIYAYGLRNPFRFSFDSRPGGTNRLFLADVGQNLYEEVNIVTKGGNYGWVLREGKHCFDPFNPTVPPATCATTGAGGEPLIDPIIDYIHSEGGITVIGGFVYRGVCTSMLTGRYVFGDFSASFGTPGGRLYYLVEPTAGNYEIREFQIGMADVPYGLYLKGFGEDEDGNLFTCGSTALAPFGTGGVVHKIVPQDCQPIAVTLARLSVTRRGGDAVLAWEVAGAEDHLGFHVYREDGEGQRVPLTGTLLSGRTRYEFTDRDAPRTAARYWLAEISRSGERTWHGPVVLEPAKAPAAALVLAPASPNPFHAGTRITFAIPAENRVRVGIHDIEGRLVALIADQVLPAGDHSATWNGLVDDGRPAPAGFYVVRVTAGDEVKTRKVLLTR